MEWKFWKRSSNEPVVNTSESPAIDPRAPSTLRTEQGNRHLDRPVVFDPALKHFVNAHRAGEPLFESETEQAAWNDVRNRVLHKVLTILGDSCWRPHLVLRGSALMSTWFGDLARRPGDLDFVVDPNHWHPQDAPSRALLKGIVGLVEGVDLGDEVTIPRGQTVQTDIWLYEKAPGVRIVAPWNHPDARRSGTVQMDFVFREPMPTSPRPTEVKFAGLPRIELLAATPEQSLAWKILWLATDWYASGKDLYDAVLLAEAFPITAETIHATFRCLHEPDLRDLDELRPNKILGWDVLWEDFIKEYPFVSGTADEWKARLATALTPALAQLDRYR